METGDRTTGKFGSGIRMETALFWLAHTILRVELELSGIRVSVYKLTFEISKVCTVSAGNHDLNAFPASFVSA